MDRAVSRNAGNGDDDDVVPPPKCDLRAFWKEAVAAGAPADAVAEITYDRNGWSFAISALHFGLKRYGADCKGKEPAGEVGGAPTPAVDPPVPAPAAVAPPVAPSTVAPTVPAPPLTVPAVEPSDPAGPKRRTDPAGK